MLHTRRNHQFNTPFRIRDLNPRFTSLSSKKYHPYLLGLDVDHVNSDFRTQLGVAISAGHSLLNRLYSKRVLLTYTLAVALILGISSSTDFSAKLLPTSKPVLAASQNFVAMTASITEDNVPTFSWPVHGYISTYFSIWHPGLDIPNPYGNPVHSAAPGVVTEVDSGRFGYGKEVVVTHGSGYTTRYAHLSKINVKLGDEVTTSTVIGNVGSTGHSTGNHVHFEIRIDDRAINPLNVLPVDKTQDATNY